MNDAADFTETNGCYLYQGRGVTKCGKNNLKDEILVIDEFLTSNLGEHLKEVLQGKDRLEYLTRKVKDETAARKKKVYFIRQKDSKIGANITKFREFLGEENCGSDILDVESLGKDLPEDDIEKEMNKYLEKRLDAYDVVVYEVNRSESRYEGNASNHKFYGNIQDYCRKNHKECIHCCLGFHIDHIDWPPIASFTYTLDQTLREILYS